MCMNKMILLETDHGIVFERHDTKKYSTVRVKRKGARKSLITYIFPNAPQNMFESPYISWDNLNCCNGWSYNKNYLLTAVQAGKKLCANITFNSQQQRDSYIATLDKGYDYFASEVIGVQPWYNLEVSLKGCISDYIDLEKVERYYEDLLVAHPKKIDFDKVKTMCSVKMIDLFNMGESYNVFNPTSREDYIVTGLLFGYPLESTSALI